MIDPAIKLFSADKNYILKEAQADLKVKLLESAAYRIIDAYHLHHNSLGLIDELIIKLDSYTYKSNAVLENMYYDIAGYYRYQNADNQLEFLFDGQSHYDKFTQEWSLIFLRWIDDFCKNYHFHKALLGATVFYPGPNGEELLDNRIRAFLNKYFNLKCYRYGGTRKIKVA